MIFGLLVLAGCPPDPKITAVTDSGSFLLISGTGFSKVPTCADLILIGLPPPAGVVTVGQAPCAGGSFTDVKWKYSYVGCNPSTTTSVDVVGSDTGHQTASGFFHLGSARKTINMAWGPKCALAGTCGLLGQQACPAGCLVGGKDPSGICVKCGDEGQPLCDTGLTCIDGLHPNLRTPATAGNVVCTALCGHENQDPCYTRLSNPAGPFTPVYACYQGATFSSEGCACVASVENQCLNEVSSGDTGICGKKQVCK